MADISIICRDAAKRIFAVLAVQIVDVRVVQPVGMLFIRFDDIGERNVGDRDQSFFGRVGIVSGIVDRFDPVRLVRSCLDVTDRYVVSGNVGFNNASGIPRRSLSDLIASHVHIANDSPGRHNVVAELTDNKCHDIRRRIIFTDDRDLARRCTGRNNSFAVLGLDPDRIILADLKVKIDSCLGCRRCRKAGRDPSFAVFLYLNDINIQQLYLGCRSGPG